MFALLFGDQMTSGRVLLNEVKNRLQSVWSLLTSESAGWLAGAIKQCLVKVHSWMIFENWNWGWAGLIPRSTVLMQSYANSSFESFLQLSFKVRDELQFGISIARHSELPRRRRKVCFKEKLLPLFDFSFRRLFRHGKKNERKLQSPCLSRAISIRLEFHSNDVTKAPVTSGVVIS